VVTSPLVAGTIVWCELSPTVGREQGGRRPAVVIASADYVDVVDSLTILVPCTTRDRGWLSHIALTGDTGLSVPTFAVTEQQRTVSLQRVRRVAGQVDDGCLDAIARWVRVWLHAPTDP
jgi:mRNA interferase MazF